jgi:hypothetical protein
MGVGRLAPHRIRAKYAKALKEIPLPVRSFTGIDPAALTVVGESEVGDRRLQFGVLAGTPRLWITVHDQVPPVMGYLTGFGTRRVDLHITEPDHLDWARRPGRAAQIKRAALDAWNRAHRTCEG